MPKGWGVLAGREGIDSSKTFAITSFILGVLGVGCLSLRALVLGKEERGRREEMEKKKEGGNKWRKRGRREDMEKKRERGRGRREDMEKKREEGINGEEGRGKERRKNSG